MGRRSDGLKMTCKARECVERSTMSHLPPKKVDLIFSVEKSGCTAEHCGPSFDDGMARSEEEPAV